MFVLLNRFLPGLWPATTVLVLLGCLALFSAFIVLQAVRREALIGRLAGIDLPIMDWLHQRSPSALTPVAFFVSNLISFRILLPAVFVTLLLTLGSAYWREGAGLLGAVLVPSILIPVTKSHFRHPRPTVSWALTSEPSYSFPSGHSAFAVAVYGMAVYMVGQRVHWEEAVLAVGVVGFLLAMITGWSRVFLGVHYPTDVVGGFAVGAIGCLTGFVTTTWLYRLFPLR